MLEKDQKQEALTTTNSKLNQKIVDLQIMVLNHQKGMAAQKESLENQISQAHAELAQAAEELDRSQENVQVIVPSSFELSFAFCSSINSSHCCSSLHWSLVQNSLTLYVWMISVLLQALVNENLDYQDKTHRLEGALTAANKLLASSGAPPQTIEDQKPARAAPEQHVKLVVHVTDSEQAKTAEGRLMCLTYWLVQLQVCTLYICIPCIHCTTFICVAFGWTHQITIDHISVTSCIIGRSTFPDFALWSAVSHCRQGCPDPEAQTTSNKQACA